jgi:cytochrome bd-type quinol oxidase subunit 2
MKQSILTLFFFLLCSLSLEAETELQRRSESKTVALMLSVTSTLVPIGIGTALAVKHNSSGYVVATAGVLLGPVTGLSYSGNSRRALTGVGFRALSFGCAALAFAISENTDDKKEIDVMGDIAGGCVLVALASTVSDIFAAGKSVNQYNRTHGFSDVRMTPTYINGHRAPGVILTLSF